MKRHHAYLILFLLALCVQLFWLFLHIPFPSAGCIHDTSYRSAERHAALYEWGRHPNETTRAILDEEETRAERHEWLVSIASLLAFIIFDFFCVRQLHRQLLDRQSVAIIMLISTAAMAVLVGATRWASLHSPIPTLFHGVLGITTLILLWRVLSKQTQGRLA